MVMAMLDSEFLDGFSSVIPAREWVPMTYTEIKQGDWLKITTSVKGVVNVRQGVVHQKKSGSWVTLEGGVVISQGEPGEIHRAPRRKRGWNLMGGISALAALNKTRNIRTREVNHIDAEDNTHE